MKEHEFRTVACQFIAEYPSINSIGGQQALISSLCLPRNVEMSIQFNTSAYIFISGIYSQFKAYGTLKDGRNPLVELIKRVMNSVGIEGKKRGAQLLWELGEVWEPKEEGREEESSPMPRDVSQTVMIQFEILPETLPLWKEMLKRNQVNQYTIFRQKEIVIS